MPNPYKFVFSRMLAVSFNICIASSFATATAQLAPILSQQAKIYYLSYICFASTLMVASKLRPY
tara:strand:+ start:430 stop:621 length:192 start_codon:yes stop_codon:yes gene_type:complete